MIFYVEYRNCKEFFPFFGYIEWGANSNQWNTQIFIVFLVTTDSILTFLEFLFVFELERMAFEKNACIYDADAADFSLSLSLQCKTVSVHKDWHSFNYSSVSGSKQRQRVKSQVKKRWMNDCAWSLKNVHWNICLCNYSCVHQCFACFCWFPSFSQFDCAVQVDRMFFCSRFPLDSLFRRRVWYSSELEYFHFQISVPYATKDRYNGIYGMKSHLVLNFCWITKRWVKGVNIDGFTSLYWCWAMRIAFHLNCIWSFSWQFACLFTIRYKTTTRQQ